MLRILAVDDDITVMRTLERLLRSKGHAVETASSGEAALAAVGAVRPDLVLLDVQMPPGIDGLETLARLRREAPAVPVIIMTGMHDVDVAVRAFKQGAIDFVSKPFDEAKLLGAIDAVAEARREARTRAVTPAESRNVVAVRSTTRPSAPALSADSSASRSPSALVRSISPTAVTTAVRPDHVAEKRSSDTTTTATSQ